MRTLQILASGVFAALLVACGAWALAWFGTSSGAPQRDSGRGGTQVAQINHRTGGRGGTQVAQINHRTGGRARTRIIRRDSRRARR